MVDINLLSKKTGNSDVWLAAIIVFCLGLGAFATYSLTSPEFLNHKTHTPADVRPLQGTSFDSAVTPMAPAEKSGSGQQAKIAKTDEARPDFQALSFDVLGGFFYEDPDMDDGEILKIGPDLKTNVIPTNIVALSGKAVSVKGFMVPFKVEDGSVKSFLLVKDQMLCCFGQTPRMNDWVFVKMKEGATAEFYPDIPVTVYGILDVGEEKLKGKVLSIFRLEAERLEGPLDL